MSHLILRGDARHLPLADGSVHLVVTSPMYNAGIAYDGCDDWLPWSEYWHGLIEPALRECFRVMAGGGRLCLNMASVIQSDEKPMRLSNGSDGGRRRVIRERIRKASNRRTWRVSEGGWPIMVGSFIWPMLEQIGFLPRETLIWNKAEEPQDVSTHSTAWGTWCSARNPVLRAVCEPVFIASKGAYSREPGISDLTPAEFKAWTRNVWKIAPTGRGAHLIRHPAPFPLELPRRLIKLYSYVGDTVLDPFAGSGTTVFAANLTGRCGIGLDVSEKYCRLAAARCSQAVMPLEFIS